MDVLLRFLLDNGVQAGQREHKAAKGSDFSPISSSINDTLLFSFAQAAPEIKAFGGLDQYPSIATRYSVHLASAEAGQCCFLCFAAWAEEGEPETAAGGFSSQCFCSVASIWPRFRRTTHL